MPDLPGFSSSETAKPPSRAELNKYDREMRALAAYYEGDEDLGFVKKKLGCKSLHEARVLVNRGVANHKKERGDYVEWLKVRAQMDLDVIRQGWMPTAGKDRSSAEINFKRLEIEGKLQGLNAEKAGDGGPQFIFVDSRPPWERPESPDYEPPEVIDGEAVEPKALPGGSPSTDSSEETPENGLQRARKQETPWD